MRKTDLLSLITSAVCAVGLTGLVIWNIFSSESLTVDFGFVVNALAAVIWAVIFFISLRRYRSQNKQ